MEGVSNATGISHAVEFSADLDAWLADGVRMSSTPAGEGTVVETWRSAMPLASGGQMFGRVRVTE